MDDTAIRLECVRISGGDLQKAKELYNFVTENNKPSLNMYHAIPTTGGMVLAKK